MKLLYSTSINIPSVRANRIQIVAMARAFHRIMGENFILGVSTISTEERTLQDSFLLNEVGTGKSFILAWRYMQLARREKVTHIFCREEKMLFWMMFSNTILFHLRLSFVYEIHHLAYVKKWWFRWVLRRVSSIISLTSAMRDTLVQVNDSVLVAPDGVDKEMFNIDISKQEAREKLSLPLDKKIVMYTGSIVDWWKGTPALFESAKEFGDDYLFVLVGGKSHYVQEFKDVVGQSKKVLMVGHRPHRDIPYYLKASDILVLPNSAKEEISRIATSPMKLFEYMASGRPIVASDLPSLREILNDNNSVLVAPDDAYALARGIREVMEDEKRATALAEQAKRDVAHYAWDNRAENIISFI